MSAAVYCSRVIPVVRALILRFPFAISALDRVGLSLFNFFLNLCLVRVLSATDFGLVSLWMTITLLALDVQQALVKSPLSVHLPGVTDVIAARRLGAALASVNLATIVGAAALFGIANALAEVEGTHGGWLLGIALPVFVATGMSREYYRGLAFGRSDMALLLWIDAPYLIVTSACLVPMMLWPESFAGLATCFIAMSVGSIVSRTLLRLRRGTQHPGLFRPGWFASYRAILGDVWWALVGVCAGHVQSRSYLYVATSLAGLAATASLNVVGLLFRPLLLMSNSWGSSALPKLAMLLARGDIAGFDRTIGRALIFTATGTALWVCLLSLAWDAIAHLVLAGKYPDAHILLVPCAVAFAFWVVENIVSVGLIAAREFKFLAYVAVVCGVVSVAATALMIWCLGYVGAMWGNAIGYAVACAMETVQLRKVQRRLRDNVATPAAAASALPN
jgi:O-antigen/teichoic acid export membrane protein